MTFIACFIAFMIGCAFIAAFSSARKKSTQRLIAWQRKAIAKLDLEPVRKKAMSRHGWSEEASKLLMAEYREGHSCGGHSCGGHGCGGGGCGGH